jgi:hypothetical protein
MSGARMGPRCLRTHERLAAGSPPGTSIAEMRAGTGVRFLPTVPLAIRKGRRGAPHSTRGGVKDCFWPHSMSRGVDGTRAPQRTEPTPPRLPLTGTQPVANRSLLRARRDRQVIPLLSPSRHHPPDLLHLALATTIWGISTGNPVCSMGKWWGSKGGVRRADLPWTCAKKWPGAGG